MRRVTRIVSAAALALALNGCCLAALPLGDADGGAAQSSPPAAPAAAKAAPAAGAAAAGPEALCAAWAKRMGMAGKQFEAGCLKHARKAFKDDPEDSAKCVSCLRTAANAERCTEPCAAFIGAMDGD